MSRTSGESRWHDSPLKGLKIGSYSNLLCTHRHLQKIFFYHRRVCLLLAIFGKTRKRSGRTSRYLSICVWRVTLFPRLLWQFEYVFPIKTYIWCIFGLFLSNLDWVRSRQVWISKTVLYIAIYYFLQSDRQETDVF